MNMLSISLNVGPVKKFETPSCNSSEEPERKTRTRVFESFKEREIKSCFLYHDMSC